MENNTFIAYLRRSKKEQESTLGLESQNIEVQNYVSKNEGVILNTYVEIESGTSKRLNKRKVIWDAIEECKEKNATLIIAKLDRLARDVEFTARLQNTGIRFIACDIPQANEFTIHVMAAVAQQEAKRISERTKQALNRKRQKGEPLGFWTHRKRFTKLDDVARNKAVRVIKEKALQNPNNLRARGYCQALRSKGISYREIAERMTNEGYKSPTNKKITPVTVMRWLY
jgi:DNA invertase Pin-like site-specific DNA recombinase